MVIQPKRLIPTTLAMFAALAALLAAPLAFPPSAQTAPPKGQTVGPKAPKAAAAARPWIQIYTPPRMKAAKKLRYRIFCRDACNLAVTTKLKWPNRPNLVTTIRGKFRAGESRANILTLNNPARNTLKANWRRTVLQIVVRARNRETGAKRTLRKSVRFRPR